MHPRTRALAAGLLAASLAVPAVSQAATPLKVALTIQPVPIAIGGTVTATVRSEPGATCNLQVTDFNGAQFVPAPRTQQVGNTGTVSWHWAVHSMATSVEVFASCKLGSQGRGDYGTIVIKGRHDLPPTYRPHPSRPGIAVLGATKAAWREVFGPPLVSTDEDNEGWMACFSSGITPRIGANFRREGTNAFIVEGAYCTDNPPSRAARIKEATEFMPHDAVYIGTHRTDTGTDLVYYSDMLASSSVWVPGDFEGCGYDLVRRGTFSLSLDIPSAIDWTLQLGNCA